MNNFFENCDLLDYYVLRPLDHIKPNWELRWDKENLCYFHEDDSFAELLNQLINDLNQCNPPKKYHDHEDKLAEYVRTNLKWKIQKIGSRWVGMNYKFILEQGGYNDTNQNELLMAAAGRIKAAINRKQTNFDDMETSHKDILSGVLAIILYHREWKMST
jgi:hypothetical protein